MHTTLAARTDFSLGESIISAEMLPELALQAGEKVVALTDTMSVTGMIEFSKKAIELGVKPIIGARLRISENALWRPDKALKEKKRDMPKAFFLTYYVRSEAGLKALFRLLTLANDEHHFYYTSKLGWSEVLDGVRDLTHADYALVLGDEQSLYQHKDFDAILNDIKRYDLCAYLPVILVNTPYHGAINRRSMEIHRASNLPLLAVRPALYEKDGADAQEIMTGVCENMRASDGFFRSRFSRDLHPMTRKEILTQAKLCGEHLIKRGVGMAGTLIVKALSETVAFSDAVTYTWKKQDPCLPKLADDEFGTLVKECQKGFVTRFAKPVFGHQPSKQEQREVYLPRLKYELGILEKLGFASYFLNVQDIVMHAKQSGILVGPGRGSVGGSLVAYLTGITDIDPIRFGLLFERFINPERLDLPDADLDFMSERRHEVVEYLINKFGADRVAGVSNFSTLGSPSAIRGVGKVMGLSEPDFACSKFVPKKHGQTVDLETARADVAEIANFSNQHGLIWPIMTRLEGSIRNMAQHAAGIVIADRPITEFGVVEKRKTDAVVCWDKRVIEEQGLVKIDLLGLTTLDVIGLAQRYIEEYSGKTVDISEIPLDDPDILRSFAEGRTTGVFQFESAGMKKLLRDLGAMTGSVTFEDITACTALYRPGPMESGMMDSFAKRKRGDESIEYIHPLAEDFTKETYGILVYQEQVMKVAQFIAGYTGPEADKLRKIMGKKLPAEMAKQRDKFVKGCVATIGACDRWADNLFDTIAGFAGYGFNKSHAAAYSLISYQAMYLKVKHPLEFYAAVMTMLGQDKLTGLMSDAKKQGVVIVYPDINRSSDRFEIARAGNEIVVPFQRVKGISTKSAAAILEARKSGGRFTSKQDFIDRVDRRSCNVRVQDSLDRVGAFAAIEPGQVSANDPSRIKDQIDLLPGLVSDYVPVNRAMNTDKTTKQEIIQVVDDYRHAFGTTGDGIPARSNFGKTAQVMVISDAPNGEEESNGVIGYTRSFDSVLQSMSNAGFDMKDIYATALIKRPKSGRQVTPNEVTDYASYLQRELDALKPPVIVLMGSQTVRSFFPSFKGKASDAAGDVIYSAEMDANVVIAFSPGEIWHDPDKQNQMDKVWSVVAELINP